MRPSPTNFSSQSPSSGLKYLFIYLTTLLWTLAFWYFPLSALDKVRISYQNPDFADQNYYLFVAHQLCNREFVATDDFIVTWSAEGIIKYLYYGCRTFGSDFFFLLINPLIFIVAMIIYLRLSSSKESGVQSPPALLLCLPYTLILIGQPGKEVLSVVGTLIAVRGFIQIVEKQYLSALPISVVGLAIAFLNRPHEALILLVGFLIYLCLRTSVIFTLLTAAVFSLLVPEIIKYAGQYMGFKAAIQFSDLWSSTGDNRYGQVSEAANLLQSDNFIVHSLLSPVRAILLLLSPLSTFLSDPSVNNIYYFIYRWLAQALRLIDIFIIYFILWKVSKMWRQLKLATDVEILLPVTIFVTSLFVISYFGVSQKSRYIFQYAPLLVLAFNCHVRLSQKHGTYSVKKEISI
jgi:hypothetical protein